MDANQFNHEYAHLSDYLDRFAYKLTRDHALAQDLVQDTLYRALSNCDRFEAGTNFKAWMSTIMRNTFVSAYRKRQRGPRQVTLVNDTGEILHQSSVGNEGPHNLHLDELEATLSRVDPLYAKPFVLFYSGFRYEEIALAMELPLGTVKSRIFTARKQLRALIDADQSRGLPQRANVSIA